MTLRRVLSVTVAVVAVLALTAAGALVGITTQLHAASRHLGEATESVRAAAMLQASIADLNRERAHRAVVRDGASLVDRRRLEAQVREALAATQRHVSTAAEAAIAAEIARALGEYFRVREHAGDPAHGTAAAFFAVQPSLQAAQAAIHRLVELNYGAAVAAQRAATRWDRIANAAGVGAGLAMLGVAVALLLLARRQLYRPVLAVRAAIAQYGSGERTARAPVQGVVELREVAAAFNGLADALGQQRSRQLEFLAGVAHDLRNPLTALKLGVSAAQRETGADPRATLDRLCGVATRQLNRLDRMVGDLLDASRIEAGQLELRPEPRDLRECARDVVALFQPSSPSHALTLDVPADAVLVDADPVRLEQVLVNLVSNAIKYSPRGGNVTVAVARVRGQACVAVTDQGVGLSPADVQRVFEPYWRNASMRDSVGGSGLGLSVARRIVEAHRGRIEIESRPGEGTTFRVLLPARPGDHATAPEPGRSDATAAVDDAAHAPPLRG